MLRQLQLTDERQKSGDTVLQSHKPIGAARSMGGSLRTLHFFKLANLLVLKLPRIFRNYRGRFGGSQMPLNLLCGSQLELKMPEDHLGQVV